MNEPYRLVNADGFLARWAEGMLDASPETTQRWRATLEGALAEAAPIAVPNGSARDIAAQWMAGQPAYDPADITVPTLVIVGAADVDTPPALARAVFERLGSATKFFAAVPGGTHFTMFPAEPRPFVSHVRHLPGDGEPRMRRLP